jgi:plasmid maintenance system antidote protein VapI
MTDLLRRALTEAESLRAIQTATGIDRASLRRFRDGETSLRLDLADKLAAYFGIESKRKGR